ncbi:MAG: hypothetical protein RR382_00760 [Tannerellaceae bacterium]
MIFNEEEMASRRQFHELFCTKFLYTGDKKGAINEDPWNNIVINDILHVLHDNNILTPQDIETMMQMGGMYDHNHEAYFHYHRETPIIQEILASISPFISQAAFVKFKQLLNGRSTDSVTEFIQRCCNDQKAEMSGVTTVELYELYSTWCTLNRMPISPRHVLYTRVKSLGFKHKKGYLNGACGVTYFMIKFNREEVTKIAQSEGEASEEGQDADSRQSLRDVTRTGTTVRKKANQGKTPDVLQDEVRQDTPAGSGGDFAEHATDGTASGEADRNDANDDGIGRPVDTDTESSTSDIPEPRDFAPTEAHPEGTDADIQTRVKKLPMELRQSFKLLKATYRVSPEHFTEEDFKQAIDLVDVSGLQEEQTLYGLFLEYAKNN